MSQIIKCATYRLPCPLASKLISPNWERRASSRLFQHHRAYQRGFLLMSEMILSDNLRQRPNSRAAQACLRSLTLPQHTWYVGVGVHRNATFTAQQSRNWLPHAFGLRARLRAFSLGYRVLPIPNRKGQSPKSSKSAASGYRRRPTRGGTTGSKGHYF